MTKTKLKGIQNLIKFLKRELEGMETSNQMMSGFCTDRCDARKICKPFEPNKAWQKRSFKDIHTASSLNVQIRKLSCIFCPGLENHTADECKKAEKMPYEQIRAIIIEEKACWRCLKKGHRVVDCRQKQWIQCKICNATNHHTLLHIDRINNNENVQAVSYKVCTKISTIMPLAVGQLIGPNGKSARVNVMLDIGSDTSFIREDLAKSLKLHGKHVEMSINGINGTTDSLKPRRMVEAQLGNRTNVGEVKSVKLVEIKRICIANKRPAVDVKVLRQKYLRDLQLADDYTMDGNEKIDVLT